MGSILDNYKKQLEEDKLNETNEIPDEFAVNGDKEAVAAKVKELKEDPNDMENLYKQFEKEWPRITEKEFDENGNSVVSDVKICVKHIFCPKCGKELISRSPVMYNPFSLEKVAKHECECGFKANLEHAYPRLVFINNEGKEIKAFSD